MAQARNQAYLKAKTPLDFLDSAKNKQMIHVL